MSESQCLLRLVSIKGVWAATIDVTVEVAAPEQEPVHHVEVTGAVDSHQDASRGRSAADYSPWEIEAITEQLVRFFYPGELEGTGVGGASVIGSTAGVAGCYGLADRLPPATAHIPSRWRAWRGGGGRLADGQRISGWLVVSGEAGGGERACRVIDRKLAVGESEGWGVTAGLDGAVEDAELVLRSVGFLEMWD